MKVVLHCYKCYKADFRGDDLSMKRQTKLMIFFAILAMIVIKHTYTNLLLCFLLCGCVWVCYEGVKEIFSDDDDE